MPRALFDNFHGGLYLPGELDPTTVQPEFTLPPNALIEAENLEYLPSGGVRGRRGRLLLDTLPGEVRALFRHYPRAMAAQAEQRYRFGRPSASVVVSNDATVGTATWTTSLHHQAEVSLLGGTISKYLLTSGLGFAIPTSDTILGIQVRVSRSAAGGQGTVKDSSVKLFKAGVVAGGDDKAETTDPWQTESMPMVYGDHDDLWGVGWTAAEVNAANFGVGIAVEGFTAAEIARVESIVVLVWYATGTDSVMLAAYQDGTLNYVKSTGAAFAAITGVSTALVEATARPRFVTWPEKNQTFIFDGINPVRSYENHEDGTDIMALVATGASGIPPHRGPYATVWKNRLWATDPAEIAYSVYATEVNDATDWPPDLQLSCNEPQGGSITGLVGVADRLLILKSTALFYFVGDIYTGGQLVRYSDMGAVAPDSIALTPFGVVFVGQFGVYVTDGESGVPTKLSDPIGALFTDRGASRVYPEAVGVYFDRKSQYWLKLDPADDDGYVLHRVMGKGADGTEVEVLAWSHMPVMPMLCAGVWPAEGDDGRMYVGDVDGAVREVDVGAGDDGAAIACALQTAALPLDPRRVLGRVYYVKPLYRGTVALDGGIRYDNALADTVAFTAGSVAAPVGYQHPRTTISTFANFGRFFSIRLENPSDGPVFELHQIECDTQLRGERRWP